ncbi:MAG TPA: S9 family peptidase, partial [Thermoanaerobaculia bacterium]|nr:S9 family peptidase [Thermoanaerobaculia bacterium]
STNADIWIVDLKTPNAAPRNITASNRGYDNSPQYSPDGRTIAYRTQKTPAYESELFQLAIYDRQSGTSRIVSGTFNDWIDDFHWSGDGKSILFTGPVEGRNPIYRADLAGGAIAKLFDDQTIDAFEVAKNGSDLFYIHRSVGEASEIYRATLTGGAALRKKLSHVNDAVANEVDIRPAETIWVGGAQNQKVQVYIVKPHGFDPARKYPLILNVHGGPQSQFGDAFRADWQVYPGAGYVVAFANPHGSTGYGQPYTTEISGDWGGAVFEDLMKVTDALEKLPYVDRNRMGAMGWSYGGYMMNWFEGHTDRFKAIASMMGIFDNRSFFGATEELWFPEWDLKGQPWNSPLYEKFSPSDFVSHFHTPCLVITGEHDYRVPYTQGLQMFTALQKQHVPSRLIVYANAGHWPSWYEMALYYTAHLEWFQKYLGGGAPPWSTEAFLRNAVFDTSSGKRIEEKPKN